MATTVHLPPPLLESVDRRAADLGISRNRYITRALERAVAAETGWSPAFVEELAAAREDADSARALEELRRVVKASRTSKTPPEL